MATPNLELPYIIASQAQKEVTHAESLNKLDALVQCNIISKQLSSPPSQNTEGDVYLVASNATDSWLNQDEKLAQFIGGNWAFYTPKNGWRLWDKEENQLIIYNGTNWQPVTQLKNVSVSTLPTATSDGLMIFVNDESGGAVPAFSHSNQWLRITDRAVVS